MVKAQLPLILAVQDEDYWQDITLPMLDEVRRHLRDLVQIIDRNARPTVYTDLPDPLDPSLVAESAVPTYQPGFSAAQYRKKVEQIIRDNESHVAIGKLKRNQPLTDFDLAALETMLLDPSTGGTREQFDQICARGRSLPHFIRELVGLDRNTAKASFSRYLAGQPFTANQIRFVETVIDYLTNNGVMDPGLLYEPPFTDRQPDGVEGLYGDDDVDNIISIVRSFNESVGAKLGAA